MVRAAGIDGEDMCATAVRTYGKPLGGSRRSESQKEKEEEQHYEYRTFGAGREEGDFVT
jgi:hypothetical protein